MIASKLLLFGLIENVAFWVGTIRKRTLGLTS